MTLPEPADQPQRYTFLLSLWRESTSAPWRVALRAADGETRLGFATIEQLAAFLRRITAKPRVPQDQEGSDSEGAGNL
jgi:hypothetical protein